MIKHKLKNPIFIFYLLVFYVFAQFMWWWYLIFKLNKSIYTTQEFFNKKIWMIGGEGLVFLIFLILGIIAVKRAFKRQEKLTKEEARLVLDQGNFVLSVSHELKTPIAAVQLFLQTLQKHKQLTDEEKNNIQTKALYEIERLNTIVNNILLTKQIEKNDYPIHKTQTNLKHFIENKTEIYRQLISKNHQIKLNIENVIAMVDLNAFDSILTNIVENSVKYSPPNSTINISLTNANNSFILTIADTGKGITDENKSKIFNKFFREQNELTRQTQGTGLGLYIVNYLVKKHNGIIKLKDNQPKGLVVEIKIPKQ